jgi:hypothetical protein
MKTKPGLPQLTLIAIAIAVAGGASYVVGRHGIPSGIQTSAAQNVCVFVNGVRRTPGGDPYQAGPDEECTWVTNPTVADAGEPFRLNAGAPLGSDAGAFEEDGSWRLHSNASRRRVTRDAAVDYRDYPVWP